MAKYYKQEKGVMNAPSEFKKWHISWMLDNVLEGFKQFYNDYSRWPIGIDFKLCSYLPNVKTIERNFGGITKIRELLGFSDVDYSRGKIRSSIAKTIGKRGFNFEEEVYKFLLERFYEPYVHCQSRVVIKDASINLDFLVFHKSGKFAVDVFYPDSEKQRWTNNISVKYNTYKNFPYKIYLCIGNKDISRSMIDSNVLKSKIYRNPNALLVTFDEFIKIVNKYEPLNNPYI